LGRERSIRKWLSLLDGLLGSRHALDPAEVVDGGRMIFERVSKRPMMWSITAGQSGMR
jgi:hypothetical protein